MMQIQVKARKSDSVLRFIEFLSKLGFGLFVMTGKKVIEWFEGETSLPSANHTASLARQEQIIAQRRQHATQLAETTEALAAKAAEERLRVTEAERDSAKSLLEATEEVKAAANTLSDVQLSAHTRNNLFNESMGARVEQLAETVQHLPQDLQTFNLKLQLKQQEIEVMQSMLSILQKESSERDVLLQQMVAQVITLKMANQEQEETIRMLHEENATCLRHIEMLTQEINLLTTPQDVQENLITHVTSTLFGTL